MRRIIQSPIGCFLADLSLVVVFTLGFSTGVWGKSLQDYPEACRKPIGIAAIEIPYDQIDLSASEWDPGTFDPPPAVRSYIVDISNRMFLYFAGLPEYEFWEETPCYFSLSDMVGPIYRLSIDQRYDVFLYRARGLFGSTVNHLILYDQKIQTISGRVPVIGAQWDYGADMFDIRVDWIDFEDLDGDGEREFRIAQVLHSSNVYNAVAYHYFDTGNATLNRELVVEFYTLAIGGGHIERKIVKRSAHRVLLVSEWFDEYGQLELSQRLPLFRKKNGQPFQSRLEDLVNYRGILTYCFIGPNIGPNHFFEHGCVSPEK